VRVVDGCSQGCGARAFARVLMLKHRALCLTLQPQILHITTLNPSHYNPKPLTDPVPQTRASRPHHAPFPRRQPHSPGCMSRVTCHVSRVTQPSHATQGFDIELFGTGASRPLGRVLEAVADFRFPALFRFSCGAACAHVTCARVTAVVYFMQVSRCCGKHARGLLLQRKTCDG